METILSETIQNELLRIDGKTFIDCTLVNCTLEYSGKPVVFDRTRLKRCSYVFTGEAKRFLDFLQTAGIIPATLPSVREIPA